MNPLELEQPFESPVDLSGLPEDTPFIGAIQSLARVVDNPKMPEDVRAQAKAELDMHIQAAKNNDYMEIQLDESYFVQDPTDPNRLIGPTIKWRLGSNIVQVTPQNKKK